MRIFRYLVLFENHLEKGEICGKQVQVRPEVREGSVRILPVRSGFLKQALAVAGRVADPGGEDPNLDPKMKIKTGSDPRKDLNPAFRPNKIHTKLFSFYI